MLLIQIAGALVLVALVAAFFVRGRGGKAKRATRLDGGSNLTSRRDGRPTLPPSPYPPSRGFRILNGDEPIVNAPVARPRLDANKEFVFNDAGVSAAEPLASPHLRHDEKWALERSIRHTPHPHVRRRRLLTWFLVLVVVAAGVAAALTLRHSGSPSTHNGLSVGRAWVQLAAAA